MPLQNAHCGPRSPNQHESAVVPHARWIIVSPTVSTVWVEYYRNVTMFLTPWFE